MTKQCPFCSNAIDSTASKCPRCNRVLIEHLGGNSPRPDLPKKEQKTLFFDKLKRSIRSFKMPTFNSNYLGVIPLIILGIVLVSNHTSNAGNISGLQNTAKNTSEKSLPVNYNRLPNGQIISSTITNSSDLGTLKIDNGTDNDAVIKLLNTKADRSVFTVYIQAKSNFTITQIPDGTYDLYFQTGKDWDTNTKKFLFYPSYSKFSDNFQYTTTSSEYATYRVTLNPVVGGTATTNDVMESEYEKY